MKIEEIKYSHRQVLIQFLESRNGELFTAAELHEVLPELKKLKSSQYLDFGGPERTILFRGKRRFGSIASVEKAKQLEAGGTH